MSGVTELMSPAGYWPQLQAAIEAGADAVYFGLKQFSARAKVGFDLEEMPQVMQTLHRRGVKGYVTFNTLVFDHEITQARESIAGLIAAGVDSLIVQDIGMAKMIQEMAPGFPIHGSTQMSISTAEGAELAKTFGCSRVVLARELSLSDIRKIREQTDVELEVFVHGALCVSYSGQCFSSEAWGGRSANRGQCAQACRLSYDLIVDGLYRDLGADRYLLSPGDLMAIDHIPALVELGISCLKIEGRYKDAEYVAVTTGTYRKALDAALALMASPIAETDRDTLEQVYSRGLGDYFISGTDHQRVVHGRAPRHRGIRIGTVSKVLRDSVIIACDRALARGEGVVFDAADRRSPDVQEQGGFVYDVREDGENLFRVWFSREGIDLNDIRPGDWVWRTQDPQVDKRIKPILKATKPIRTQGVQMKVTARVGEPLVVHAILADGRDVTVRSEQIVEAAKTNGATAEWITTYFDRLGGTAYHLADLAVEITDAPFLPASLLNQVRRELVEKLEARQLARTTYQDLAVVQKENEELRSRLAILTKRDAEQPVEAESASEQSPRNARLHLLVRTPAQLEAAIELRPDSVTLDYLELYGLRQSVDRLLENQLVPRVASPRVLKPSEQKVVRFLLSLDVAILVRSGGLLFDLLKVDPADRPPLFGDFSLNVANRLSAEAMLDMGLERLNPTHDLNAAQVIELAREISPRFMEVTVLQHLPIFHMEHCVFCRFLSTGTDNTNCGHPCEKHRLAVRDGSGRSHPVMADVGCRNTVFNAELQSGAKHLDGFLTAGINDLRLEFVHQSEGEVVDCVTALRGFLDHSVTAEELDRLWNRATPCGTTEGSLFVPKTLVQLKG